MAGPYFWVGGSGNWSDATNHWATISGGVPNAANVPTSTDDVSFDILSNTTAYTVTVDATANCKDMTWALPAVSGVPTLTVNSLLNIFGSATLVAGLLTGGSSQINFGATSTGKTITSAGVIWGFPVVFNGVGGGWTLQDDFELVSTNRTITVQAGALNTNGKTVTCGFFVSITGTRTLTLDNSTINVKAANATAFSLSSTSTLTITAVGSTINIIGGTAGGGITATMGAANLTEWNNINVTAAGTVSLNFGNPPTPVKNLSYTSTTDKRDGLRITTNNVTISASGSLTLAGNSTVNRAFVFSDVLGTQRTITVPNTATVSLTNVDFQDIASAGTFGTWTGTSLGDALGNSGITFDGSTTQTYAGGTNNWSTAAAWTSRVPLPQDDVVVNTTTAGTLTADMPRLGRNIDFTGFTRTFSGSATVASYGNLTLASGMTFNSPGNWNFQGRGAQTLTSATKTFNGQVTIQSIGGTYTLQDNLSVPAGTLQVTNGTLAGGAFDVSMASFPITGTFTRAISGSGTWSVTATSATPWNATTVTGLTVSGFTGTIKYTGNVTTTATFAGGGLAWPNLWWSSTTATGTLIITGANTINDVKINRTTARGLRLPAGATTTIGSWTDESLGTAILTVDSSTAGVAATLSKPGGDVRTNYLSIRDSTATGGANWRAGPNSTSVSNNSGWIFGNVDYANSATLTGAAAVAAAAAKNAKPSAALVCATILAGNITAYGHAAAGALTGASALTGAISGAAVASGSLTAADALSGSSARSTAADGALGVSAAASGVVSAHDRVAASPLNVDAAVAGSTGAGAIAAFATLGTGAGLGGSQVSSYSEEGSLDAGAGIAGRAIFQAESMTVEVLPSSATVDAVASSAAVEVLPSSVTTTARYR